MTPVRTGLIGAGRIAQAYVAALHDSKMVELAAVVDPRTEAAESLATEAGCPFYASHEDMAEVEEVEAVVVCTPPATHPDIATYFLERGVHVLSEKPLATTVEDGARLLETARASGSVLTMASKFRFVQDVIRAKSVVAAGLLGEVILFENSFTARVDMTKRWNSVPAVSGGGVLIDNGTHSVDIARLFMGPITEVMAREAKRVQSVEVEDTVQMFLRSENGSRGTIDLSWSIDKELENYIGIYGSEGTIQIGWERARYRQVSSPNWVSFGTGYDKIAALRRQVENFGGAIRGSEQLMITDRDGLASIEVVAAAYRSLEKDVWIPVQNGVLK